MSDAASDLSVQGQRARIHAHCSSVPPWWRVFARRAWWRRLRALLALESMATVSSLSGSLAKHYPTANLVDLANRPSATFSLIKRTKRAAPRKKRK